MTSRKLVKLLFLEKSQKSYDIGTNVTLLCTQCLQGGDKVTINFNSTKRLHRAAAPRSSNALYSKSNKTFHKY